MTLTLSPSDLLGRTRGNLETNSLHNYQIGLHQLYTVYIY